MAEGTPKNFLKRYKFTIACGRIGDGAFQKCSEFEQALEVNEYAEGGSIFPAKDAGRLKFTNVTLMRGQTNGDNDFEDWMTEASSAGDDIGGVGDAYKDNMDIQSLTRAGAIARTYTLFLAFPCRVKVGPWDNTSSEHVFQEAEIAFDYGYKTFPV